MISVPLKYKIIIHITKSKAKKIKSDSLQRAILEKFTNYFPTVGRPTLFSPTVFAIHSTF